MITVKFSRLNIKPGHRILDIGCGSGRHISAAYVHEKVTAIGADLCHTDLLQGVKRLSFHDHVGAHKGGSWAFTMADITQLPFADASFDVVLCSEVMEHIPHEEAAAKELLRVLKPGCPLVVSVPRFWPEKICWLLSEAYASVPGGHLRIYTKKPLVRLIERHGATYKNAHHAHSIHAPYWWLKCLVGPSREDHWAVNLYKRFLEWDILSRPRFSRFIDRLLNPVMGKSLVLYFTKNK